MQIYTYRPQNQTNKNTRKKYRLKGWHGLTFKKVFTWFFRIVACGIFLLALLFLYYSKNLPDPNQLLNRQVPQSTKIYARDGTLLYEIHGEVKRI